MQSKLYRSRGGSRGGGRSRERDDSEHADTGDDSRDHDEEEDYTKDLSEPPSQPNVVAVDASKSSSKRDTALPAEKDAKIVTLDDIDVDGKSTDEPTTAISKRARVDEERVPEQRHDVVIPSFAKWFDYQA